ncbi:MAG: hypothetical protein PVI23_08375, partial [Maricaulaceae bacterium]
MTRALVFSALLVSAPLTPLFWAPAHAQTVSPRVDQRRVAVDEAAILDAPDGEVVVRLRRGAPVLAAPRSQDGLWIAVDYIDPDTLAFAHGWARAAELSAGAPLVLRDPGAGSIPRFEGACTERRMLSGGGAVCLGVAGADLRCRRSFDPERPGVESCDLDLELYLDTDAT